MMRRRSICKVRSCAHAVYPISSCYTHEICQVLRQELRAIVELDAFLLQAHLQVCTGPYVLCYMMQQVLHIPFLVYSGWSLSRSFCTEPQYGTRTAYALRCYTRS